MKPRPISCRHHGSGILRVLLAAAACTAVAISAPRSARGRVAHVKLPPPEMHRDSSRFLNDAAQVDFLSKTVTRLSMNSRDTDPFGLPQDPDAEPPKPKQEVAGPLAQPKPKAIPFSRIVSRIKVTTIIPKEKRFLIDSRSFQAGDTLSLRFQGKVIDTKVESVSATAILLRNSQSDEVAAIPVNLLPSGMQAGMMKLDSDDLFKGESDSPILLDPTRPADGGSIEPDHSLTSPPSPFSP